MNTEIKTFPRTLTLVVITLVLLTCLILSSCGGKEVDLLTAENAILLAEKENALLGESETELSYMISCNVDGTTYELGAKNTISITGRHTDSMRAYRVNTFNGEEYRNSENFYYSDGRTLLIRYGERFLSPIDGEEFLKYTDSSELSLDPDIFSPKRFEKCRRSGKTGDEKFVFEGGNEELGKMICDFLGFSSLNYVYSVKDIEMTVETEGGLLLSKRITFELSYYDEKSPADVMTYEGDFRYTLVSTSDVNVRTAPLTGKEQVITSTEVLDLFAGKGYSRLFGENGLDLTFKKSVVNADSAGKVYTMKDEVRFTQKTVDGQYRYGSADVRSLRTPTSYETSSTGVFIDGTGFHMRSSDGKTEDSETPPYSEAEMRLMIADTVTGEALYESDIGSLKITEDDEYYIYTYTLSGNVVTDYGEYLLSAFMGETDRGSVDLSGHTYSVIKNTGTLKVRKSDGMTVYQSFSFDCVFAGSLEVSTEFSVVVNATGDDVRVVTVTDYVLGGDVL